MKTSTWKLRIISMVIWTILFSLGFIGLSLILNNSTHLFIARILWWIIVEIICDMIVDKIKERSKNNN